jgi:hypothetical protein
MTAVRGLLISTIVIDTIGSNDAADRRRALPTAPSARPRPTSEFWRVDLLDL